MWFQNLELWFCDMKLAWQGRCGWLGLGVSARQSVKVKHKEMVSFRFASVFANVNQGASV